MYNYLDSIIKEMLYLFRTQVENLQGPALVLKKAPKEMEKKKNPGNRKL